MINHSEENMITKEYINELAKELFKTWGIEDWTFGWNQNKARWGVCKYRAKRIELSEWVFDNTEHDKLDKFEDTLRHEIAHVLAGPRNGHNRIWQEWAVKLGARPYSSEAFKLKDKNKGVKWLLIDTSNNNKVIKRYYRKPPKRKMERIHHYLIPNRPQSKGALKFVKA